MGREIQDVRRARKNVPRAVAVVCVVVQDGDAPSLRRLIRCRDGHVVQVAEAASVVGACMVPRRTDEGNSRGMVTYGDAGRLKDRSDREGRDAERVRMDGGLRIEKAF